MTFMVTINTILTTFSTIMGVFFPLKKKLDDISDILEAERRFLFIKYIQIFGRDFCMIHSRPKLTLKNAWKVSLHTWKFAMS